MGMGFKDGHNLWCKANYGKDCNCQSSASPTGSAAERIAEIEREMRSLCPSEAYHAASKSEAELIANRMMDRVAELLNMIESR